MATSNSARRRSTRLLQFTDTHLLPEPDARLRGVPTLSRLLACLEHARRHWSPVDEVVVTGDVVHDDAAAYDVVARVFGGLGVPVRLIPGNHDLPEAMHARFAQAPFQVGGEFDTPGGWQVLLLESWFAQAADGEGRLGAAQLEALGRSLAHSTQPHAFVFVHHPPLPMDSAKLDELRLQDGAELCAAVAACPRVRGVSFGHAHQALDLYGRGVRFMCTPATSMQFRPRNPTFVVDDRPPGYRLIDLGADGSIASEVVWLEGYADPA